MSRSNGTTPMAVRLVVAVTDGDWFEHLRHKPDLAEVNFWAPSGASFRALTPGELFLFKLHAPRNVIVGGGVFAYANALPCSLAWEAFGEANGARSLPEMRARIARYRRAAPDDRSDFVVGCRILPSPSSGPSTVGSLCRLASRARSCRSRPTRPTRRTGVCCGTPSRTP